MSSGEGLRERYGNRYDFADGEPTPEREHAGEAATLGEVEDQDVIAGGRPEHPVQPHHMRIVEFGEHERLSSQPLPGLLRGHAVAAWAQPLHRDGGAARSRMRGPYLSGAPEAEESIEDVAGNLEVLHTTSETEFAVERRRLSTGTDVHRSSGAARGAVGSVPW